MKTWIKEHRIRTVVIIIFVLLFTIDLIGQITHTGSVDLTDPVNFQN